MSEKLPRVPLIAMGVLALVSLGTVATARIAGIAPVQVRRTAVIAAADVRFADMPDGSVQVTDARDGHVIDTLAFGSNAFIRTVMRGMVHNRRSSGGSDETPFRLEKTIDAHLSLTDPATGRRIELNGFGDLNANAFGRLIPAEGG